MEYEIIIGLEIHVQLKTKSKMFCACANMDFGARPNTTVCPICLGHPGVLPAVNEQAVEWAILAAFALNCKVRPETKFDRKNYFYPDLPKGYQISQYDSPIGLDGHLIVKYNGRKDRISIERVHLEEDTAKMIHEGNKTLLDFNRAGIPLLEIVTKPDIESPDSARAFLQELRLMMRYLGISEADMEKGELRCDANISLRPRGDSKYYPKTEIKNLNSFRAVEKALLFEVERQKKLWEAKNPPQKQSTRGWDEKKNVTFAQRTKEEIQDYRYFPEPDLPAIKFSPALLKKLKMALPELPYAKRKRFSQQYGLAQDDIKILVLDKSLADWTEDVISDLKAWLVALEKTKKKKPPFSDFEKIVGLPIEDEKVAEGIWKKQGMKFIDLLASWLVNRLLKMYHELNLDFKKGPVTAENFAEFIALVAAEKISSRIAQQILEEMVKTGGDPSHIIDEKGLSAIDEEKELLPLVRKVIRNNKKIAQEYKQGKEQVLKFLIGQLMKETKGKAHPQKAEEVLKKVLKK